MISADLHVTSYGDHGTRVVFLHGLFGQGRNWTQFAKALAPEHRIDLVDLPDHGRSGWVEHFDLIAVADSLCEGLSAGGPFALVGHSLGGKVAMVMALRQPSLVERLCVVDISPVAYQRMGEFSGYIDAMCALDLSALGQRADAEAALAPAVPNPTVRSFLLQNLRREKLPDGTTGWHWQPNLLGLRADLPALGSWPAEALADAAPYPGAVVWVAGERSDYVTPEYAPAMDRWFPRNRRVTIKNAGHWVHSEQPEVFGAVLRRFLG